MKLKYKFFSEGISAVYTKKIHERFPAIRYHCGCHESVWLLVMYQHWVVCIVMHVKTLFGHQYLRGILVDE